MTVDLDGLTSGQTYYCKAAATNTISASCGGPVVGGVKMYFNFLAGIVFCIVVHQLSCVWCVCVCVRVCAHNKIRISTDVIDG